MSAVLERSEAMTEQATEKPGVLWIARMIFTEGIRVREVEIAKRAADQARLFALHCPGSEANVLRSFVGKIGYRLRMASTGFGILSQDRITRFRMPVWAATGPIFNRLAARINERRVRRAARHFGCRHVFHSNPFFFLPSQDSGLSVHFDLVDNFFDEWPETLVGRSRKRFLFDALRRADTLSTCSQSLCDRVEEEIGRRPEWLPNGAALAEIRAWPKGRAEAVRERYGLRDRRVIAYIGNHISGFDGMELLLDAFAAARARRPELVLLIVGPGADRLSRARGLGAGHGVIAVGPVPVAEVWDYFHAADLGVLPFVPCPVTHDSLPLKVLEFGAANKPMLVTPLRELQRLGLPHTRFLEPKAGLWAEALADDASCQPPDEAVLEQAMAPFSWNEIARKLLELMGIARA